MRKTFVLGKLTGRSAEILLLEDEDAGGGSGRWLQAFVKPMSPAPVPGPGTASRETVH